MSCAGRCELEVQRSEILISALELYTPVDRSVGEALDDSCWHRHAADLVKRLVVGSELSAPGIGGASTLSVLSRSEPVTDLAGQLDALLEFGCELAGLPQDDAERARRGEVREEILHFDRIMDLEALADGRSLKRRKEFLWDAGPLAAAERLLTLLHERRVERGIDVAAWHDVSAHPMARIESDGGSISTLSRTAQPALVAASGGPGARSALEELERYALRHPLGNALALLDYFLFLSGGEPVPLVAAALARSFDEAWCDLWAAMDAHYVIVGRRGFESSVREKGTLSGAPLGGLESRYDHRRLSLGKGERLILVPALDAGLDDEKLDDIEARLNEPNRSGRIYLPETARRAFPGTRPLILRGKGEPRTTRSQDDSRFVEEYVDRIAGRRRSIHLSLEAGHVHSDRAVGAVQRRGLALGSLLRRTLEARLGRVGRLDLELTPMIDDDHVINRISYAGYRNLISGHGFPADDLILESSPLVGAIAVDLLKRAIRTDGDGFRLESLGDNLYLVSDGIRVELVQGTGSLRLGCVLFDTALAIYRADRDAMARRFFSETGLPLRDLHREMTEAYDACSNPADRKTVRTAFDRLWKTPWSEVEATSDRTPYLDLYSEILTARDDAHEDTLILNVLEDFYEPLEQKVARVAELLRVRLPMDAILFSPYGLGLRTLRRPVSEASA